MAQETQAVRMARLEGKIDTILERVDHNHTLISERLANTDGRVNLLSTRVDVVSEQVASVSQQQRDWRSKAVGLVIGASIGTGGVVSLLTRALI